MPYSVRNLFTATAVTLFPALAYAVDDNSVAQVGRLGKHQYGIVSNHWNDDSTKAVAFVSYVTESGHVDIDMPLPKKDGKSLRVRFPCDNLLYYPTALLRDGFSRQLWASYPETNVLTTARTRLNIAFATHKAFEVGHDICEALKEARPSIGIDNSDPRLIHERFKITPKFYKLPYAGNPELDRYTLEL